MIRTQWAAVKNNHKEKRYSRSFSDLLSIIVLEDNKTEKLLKRRESDSTKTNLGDSSCKTEYTNTTTTTASIETIVQQNRGKI